MAVQHVWMPSLSCCLLLNINFQLANSQFPSWEKGSKLEGKWVKEQRLAFPFDHHCFWRCYVDVSGNKILFAGNSRYPVNMTVLKIKGYGTGWLKGTICMVMGSWMAPDWLKKQMVCSMLFKTLRSIFEQTRSVCSWGCTKLLAWTSHIRVAELFIPRNEAITIRYISHSFEARPRFWLLSRRFPTDI